MASSIEIAQTNRRFDGFRNTPFLWKESLEGLTMYASDILSIIDYPTINSTAHIRLGKLIEQFVLFELEQDASVQVLKSNVQVFRDQITIGELDCLIKKLEVHLHLEIVYKFYLYDPSIPTELDRWIGPNRNDSLVLKLNKLREKQMPLLYRPETTKLLNELYLTPTDFQQQVCFKAQLFVPYNSSESSLPLINNDCIKGFYIRFGDLRHFTNYTYYIPAKLDWLVEPYAEVDWVSSQTFQELLSEPLHQRRSPLCWMKSPDGKIQKFFVVWWE